MSLASLRRDALEIFQAGIRAADPQEAVRRHLSRQGRRLRAGTDTYDLGSLGAVRVVGMGKASAAMAVPVLEEVGEAVVEGAVTVKYGHGLPLDKVHVLEAGHPLPDEAGVRGAEAILALARASGPEDLLIVLVSGGGSALSPAPLGGLSLSEKQEVTRLLLECGAPIQEINAVRKHLSRIKGGGLARAAYPARVLALLLSDVIGDDPSTIASGPTAPDPTTFADALEILRRRGIRERIPPRALEVLEAGAAGRIPETPKPGDPVFEGVRNLVVGSNALALAAAEARARALGYHTLVLSSFVEGETREVARVHAAVAREILAWGRPVPRPACILSGGETTVTLRGGGKGGRNQEFVLAAALDIRGLPGTLVLSAGTDGTDGPTDAAGAVADGTTVERGWALGLDAWAHLEANDAYPFFRALGDLLWTGPTRTNVMDLRVLLVA